MTLSNINNSLVKPLSSIIPHSRTYLDYQSTTPMDPRVLDSMLPYITSSFGNPSSRTHKYGWDAETGVENARQQIASLLNCEKSEVIFTASATEANNLALTGLAKHHPNSHFITVQTEHKAVLDPLRVLEADGQITVTYLPVDKQGLVDLQELKQAIRPNTVCISIMGINNEIGVAQDLYGIGQIAKEHKIVFHTDAAQAVGKIPIDVKEMNIGLLSMSGHKIYGPKGIGCLYIRKRPRVRLQAIILGGGQERGLRSGTVPVPLAVGLGKAAEIANKEMLRDLKRTREMSDYLRKKLEDMGNVIFNGPEKVSINKCENDVLIDDTHERNIKNGINNELDEAGALSINSLGNEIKPVFMNWYPGCLNLSFAYVEGEGLLMLLKDIALSSGSACTSASLEPSYVLRALKTDDDLAHSSIRFGIGRFTMWEELKKLGDNVVGAVKKLRDMSPLYEMVNEGVDLKSIKWSE